MGNAQGRELVSAGVMAVRSALVASVLVLAGCAGNTPTAADAVGEGAKSSAVPALPPADCVGTLQERINAAPSGSTLNLTGCTFTGGATINKPLTLVGATIKTGASKMGLTVTASNVTLRGLHITGPQAVSFDGKEKAIDVPGVGQLASR